MKLITLLAGLLAILLIGLTGPLYKAQVLDLGNMLVVMQVAALAGFITIILALVQVLFMRKNIAWAATGLSVAFALTALSFPIGMMMKGGEVPPIHDISTDLVNPPQFEAILALREGVMNPPEYLGEEVAAQQRQAYPELQSKTYSQSQEQVFDAALIALNGMGLELVASDKARGVIEASHVSPWFGFVDDVVIRIQSKGSKTIVDVRSKSRVGISDLGKNAQRISLLIAGLEAQL
jgi:uncharacterized protein (DUF1499 family)